MTDPTPVFVQAKHVDTEDGHWKPVVGSETYKFLNHVVPEASRTVVSEEAASILGQGISPTSKVGNQTGLVVGYVQSGKTLSFETVTTLAHDNGFLMVILIAGSSNTLLDQSKNRFRRDLQIDDPDRERNWVHLHNPDRGMVQTLRDVFEEWHDEYMRDEYNNRTVLITVLKNHQRLERLTELVQAVDLDGIPVMVIDDEADQASLNTQVTQQDESTTYRRLIALRDALPLHNYLQYTATPQAPLLVSIADSLSPNFVTVLTPGNTYVGGQDFFEANSGLVRTIPNQEVPTSEHPLIEPPQSLLEALRIFMLGVTVGLFEGGRKGNRSMLVHPSRLTVQHQEYFHWVRNIFEDWKSILRQKDTDSDRQELIEDLRIAYEDLTATVASELPEFDQLSPKFLSAFRQTRLIEVNARDGVTPVVDWSTAYGWILVGGQAMDRGFTIEGLTVTYMPRGTGVGNADTIQQRARFFGYKRDYLSYCRVYLAQETNDAFRNYVEHEEFMRDQLKEISESGRSLNEWKRTFILDSALRPCRDSVLEYGYVRGMYSDEWVMPRVVLPSDAVLQANQRTVSEFVASTTFGKAEGHPNRTDAQRHEVALDLLLHNVMETLLTPMRVTSSHDSQRLTGLLLQLSCALEARPDEYCAVYRMSPLTGRQRSVDDSGEVTNLFQGEAPVTPSAERGTIYPGDRAIYKRDQVSVQIHTLRLMKNEKVVSENVNVLAVWVPARFAAGWIDQEQSNST